MDGIHAPYRKDRRWFRDQNIWSAGCQTRSVSLIPGGGATPNGRFCSNAARMSNRQYRPVNAEILPTDLTSRHSSKDPKSVRVPSRIPDGGLPEASNTGMNYVG